MSRKFRQIKSESSVVASLGPIQEISQKPERRSQRQLRVGETIRHALGTLLVRQQLRNPLVIGRVVTVTEVQVSPDLKHASVLIMIAETYDHTEVLKALAQSAYEIQRHLGQLLKLTAIPRLRFRVDTLLEEAARIDKLFRDPHVLQDLREEDKEEDSSPLPSPEAEGAQEED